MKRIAISGNTYPVREQLKALGGRWHRVAKCWLLDADKAEEAQRLIGTSAEYELLKWEAQS